MNMMIWIFLAMWTVVGAQDLEQAAREIDGKLMAPCCWTQTVDKHTSGVSKEIQREVREMLARGESKDEIIAHYVSQYGKRILAVPPASGFNLMVFVLPGLFLVVGGWVVVVLVRGWREQDPVEQHWTPDVVADGPYAERLARELRERE